MFLGHTPPELGIHIGDIIIELFDNKGVLVIRTNLPNGDAKGGITPDQRDLYLTSLETAIRSVRSQGPGKLAAIVGPGGDTQAPLPLRNHIG